MRVPHLRAQGIRSRSEGKLCFCQGVSVVADGWRRRKGYGPQKRTSLGANYVATAGSANCRVNCPERALRLGKDHRNRISVVQRTGVFLKSIT
jgi:hypothetical protein